MQMESSREANMNLFSRIAIGTANWGREYNGARVSDDDQQRILDYAMSSGIDMIDTATAYGWDWTKVNSYFKVVVKIQDEAGLVLASKEGPYCIMAHAKDVFDGLLAKYSLSIQDKNMKIGASLYNCEEADNIVEAFADIIQIPYSLYDRRASCWMEYIKRECPLAEIHVRSIFLRGRILEKTTPQECIKFALCNPNIDRVIIGADSYQQFKDNLHFIHEWNRMEKHDLKLLDPRQWEEHK